jgi:hypothetical protein
MVTNVLFFAMALPTARHARVFIALAISLYVVTLPFGTDMSNS